MESNFNSFFMQSRRKVGKMNINQLHYFCVLAETEHYTRAADILSITQPSLTHSIKELEKELNVCLFTRQGRNIKINRYGQFFYERVDSILADLEKARTDLQMLVDPQKGMINLSFLHSLAQGFIPKIISEFLQIEENQEIQFILDQDTTKDIQENFLANKVDIAFTSQIMAEGFTSIPTFQQTLYLIVPLDHPLAGKNEVYLKEAAQYPFIFYNQTSGMRPVLDDLFQKINIQPKIAFELADDATVCGFVASNLGVAIIPTIYGIDRFPVKFIKIKDPVERYIYLSYMSDKYMSPPVQKFKDFIINKFCSTDPNLERLRTVNKLVPLKAVAQ